MIPRLWLIGGIAGLIVLSNGFTGCATYRYVHNAWDAEKAQATADALAAKAKADRDNAAAAAKQAEETRNMDEAHNAEIATIRADAALAERSYADSLRALQGRLDSCRASSEALGAIVAADGTRSREDRLRAENAADFREVGEGANTLAAIVKTCVSWASTVGR